MLEIEGLATKAGEFRIRGLDLTAAAGSYGVLLGPPGSGKSVLVETICGLRRVTAGRIVIDGVDVTELAPRHRGVGYVPQDYVLFPAGRVADNIVFGLRARGTAKADALREAEWVVKLLGIGHLLDRWPATLSGGEKQRVALARALATRPRLLLLDEPVSALDEGLRERVCRDLRRFQRELGITTLHISHNQEEALAVSDWAAVLHHGELLQVGTMHELLRKPGNETIARFLRSENILEGTAESVWESTSRIRFAGGELSVPGACSGPVTFVIRPECLVVQAPGTDAVNAVPARLTDIADRGVYQRLELDAGVPLIAYHVPSHDQPMPLMVGREYSLVLPADRIHVLAE